jgi:hypothetical protein
MDLRVGSVGGRPGLVALANTGKRGVLAVSSRRRSLAFQLHWASARRGKRRRPKRTQEAPAMNKTTEQAQMNVAERTECEELCEEELECVSGGTLGGFLLYCMTGKIVASDGTIYQF